MHLRTHPLSLHWNEMCLFFTLSHLPWGIPNWEWLQHLCMLLLSVSFAFKSFCVCVCACLMCAFVYLHLYSGGIQGSSHSTSKNVLKSFLTIKVEKTVWSVTCVTMQLIIIIIWLALIVGMYITCWIECQILRQQSWKILQNPDYVMKMTPTTRQNASSVSVKVTELKAITVFVMVD